MYQYDPYIFLLKKLYLNYHNPAVVESTKAASDVYSPISGEITEGNKAIADDPGSVNTDPEGESWFFKLKIKDKGEYDSLMSKDEYDKFCKENPS